MKELEKLKQIISLLKNSTSDILYSDGQFEIECVSSKEICFAFYIDGELQIHFDMVKRSTAQLIWYEYIDNSKNSKELNIYEKIGFVIKNVGKDYFNSILDGIIIDLI